MLIVLSPAKNMNFDPLKGAPRATKPLLLEDANLLSETTRKLTKSQIKTMMGISEKLVDLNYERFQHFETGDKIDGAKQAALAFNGDVYLGLRADELDGDSLKFAQSHLRILSGMYGLLRPLDAIQPYRLEMGRRLKTPRGADLYSFWGDKIALELNKALKKSGSGTLINLASNEYFKAIDKKAFDGEIITPVFKEEKDGNFRQLQFYAKRARGLMARWAIEQRIEDPAALKKFDVEGYRFNTDLSDELSWTFTRPQPPKKS